MLFLKISVGSVWLPEALCWKGVGLVGARLRGAQASVSHVGHGADLEARACLFRICYP